MNERRKAPRPDVSKRRLRWGTTVRLPDRSRFSRDDPSGEIASASCLIPENGGGMSAHKTPWRPYFAS